MLGLVSGFIAGQEWIIIIVLAAVLIFGAKKIPELAKTFGKAKGEFEKGKIEGDNELKEFKDNRDLAAFKLLAAISFGYDDTLVARAAGSYKNQESLF